MSEKCKICNLVDVTPSHLSRIHKIAWKEYKEKYSPDLVWRTGNEGRVPWNKGMSLSGDPKYKNMWTKNPHSEETKKKIKESKKKWYESHPEARMGVVKNLKKYMKKHPDFYEVRSKNHPLDGKNHPMFGKHHSVETCAKMSKITKAYMDAHPEVAKERIRRMKEVYPSSKHSKVLKNLYENPEWHDRVLSPQMHTRKMSSYEQRVSDLIKKYKLSYKFVGNGEVWIGQKNPDFINTNGEKKIIEVYSEYHVGFWKDKDYESKRSKLFAKYGFQTIFLTEQDLFARNWESICSFKLGVQI